MGASRDTLQGLRAKYDEMLAMRLAHDSGEDDAARARARMAELALRFPGALREIDDLELEVLRARVAELDAVLRGVRPVELWMEAVALFHTFARGALWAKRWLGGRKTVDLAARLEFQSCAASDALVWADDLAHIAAPPRGRIVDLVFSRVAQSLAVSDKEARQLVFGIPRSERRR